MSENQPTTTSASTSTQAPLGAMILRDVAPENEIAHAIALADLVDELWIVEDLPYAGGVAQLASVLAATSNVRVGHGIAPAPFRNPAALAMEWAALARMYPGRLLGGIGHGVPEWMEKIGDRSGSRLTLLEETITAVRGLLAGERLAVDGRYVQIDDVELVFPPEVVPSVSAGVSGPKSLTLSGRAADGTILSEGKGPDDVRRARTIIEEAGGGAGHRLTVFVGYYCGDLTKLPPPPPHIPSAWTAVGPTAEAVAADLHDLVAAGADALVLVPFGADAIGQIEVAAHEIWPLLRA